MELYIRNIPEEFAMRVISGTARGHKLIAPVGLKTRPTGDRMKEDLFNILTSSVRDAFFLDMYCGSGAIGVEALSRGAKEAVFVDLCEGAIAATKANLLKTRLKDQAQIIKMPAAQALQHLQGCIFDIVYLDPPYNSGELELILDQLVWGKFVAKDGIIIVECSSDTLMPDCLPGDGFSIFRQKKYAQTQLVFYSKEGRGNQ